MAVEKVDELAKLGKSWRQLQQRRAQQAQQVKARQPAVTATAQKLFANEVAAVTPLPDNQRVKLAPPSIRGAAKAVRQRYATTAANATEQVSDALDLDYHLSVLDGMAYYCHQPNNLQLVKQLRQDYWPIQSCLDLHGMDVERARTSFLHWIATSYAADLRCICVIHGKGWGLKPPVLLRAAYSWAIQLPQISALTEAPSHLGGSGAILLLLQKS